METRKATQQDCQQCGDPPECVAFPKVCKIVIEPVIEMGDIIRVEDEPWVSNEVTVIWRRNGSNSVMAQFMTDIPHKVDISQCTLVRKGNRKVFEGIKFERITTVGDNGSTFIVPQQRGLGFLPWELEEDDKVYRLIVEEMS